jgi:integrase
VPKGKYKHRPENLSVEVLKKVFEVIEHPGAKAYFLLLCETGLRTGEVYSITMNQLDLEHRIIRLMKESETKRAYITFVHPGTANWLREVYLPYRAEFIRKYENAVRQIGQDVEKWKEKLFPFQLSDMRISIKEAMRKALGKEFRLYDVRSFWASYMLKQGISPMIINLLQGRAPPEQFKILQQHYFVISDIELQQIFDKYAPKLL